MTQMSFRKLFFAKGETYSRRCGSAGSGHFIHQWLSHVRVRMSGFFPLKCLSRICKIYFSFQIISERIIEIHFDQLKPTVNSDSENVRMPFTVRVTEKLRRKRNLEIEYEKRINTIEENPKKRRKNEQNKKRRKSIFSKINAPSHLQEKYL